MKQSYDALRKAHHLPDVREWLSLDDELTLSDIRSGFHDKLASFYELVSTLVNPEDVSAMAEAQVFSEAEHEALAAFAQKLALLSKDCTLADIAVSPSEEAALVQRLVHEWPAIVAEMKRIVTKTKEAYSGATRSSHTVSYLG